MSNELRILPLRQYEVEFENYYDHGAPQVRETFTADIYTVETEGHINRIRFYRTGNVIREYFTLPRKITVTPVDAEAAA